MLYQMHTNIHILYMVNTKLKPRKQPNSTFLQTMLQSITVSEICRDLSLFRYSSLAKSSFPWYSSSWNSSTIKKFPANLMYIYIYFLNSSFWNSSFTANSNFTNSSFKKVINPDIFPKWWLIANFFAKQWQWPFLPS